MKVIEFVVDIITQALAPLILIAVIFYLLFTDFLPSPPIKNGLPSLPIDLITLSLTLGGVIVSIWAAIESDVKKKSLYISLAKKLVLSAVLILIFILLFFLAQLLHVDPSKREWSFLGFCRFLVYWGAVVAMFVGTFVFSFSIADLLRVLIVDLLKTVPKRKLWLMRYKLGTMWRKIKGKKLW